MKFEELGMKLQINNILIDANTTKSFFITKYEHLGALLWNQNGEWESYIIKEIIDNDVALTAVFFFNHQKLYMVNLCLSDSVYSKVLDNRLEDICIATFGSLYREFSGGKVACEFDAKNSLWSIILTFNLHS